MYSHMGYKSEISKTKNAFQDCVSCPKGVFFGGSAHQMFMEEGPGIIIRIKKINKHLYFHEFII